MVEVKRLSGEKEKYNIQLNVSLCFAIMPTEFPMNIRFVWRATNQASTKNNYKYKLPEIIFHNKK